MFIRKWASNWLRELVSIGEIPDCGEFVGFGEVSGCGE